MLTGGTPPRLDGRSSYGLSETATAILRSGTLKIQSPGIGGELGGTRDAWRRGLLADPYKKCYVGDLLPRAGRCRASDRTRKFGGYMKGKENEKRSNEL